MPTPPTDPIRERRFAAARRIAARHDRLAARRPRTSRSIDSLVRAVLTTSARWELPRAAALLELAIIALPGAWPTNGRHECRAVWHGYRLRLDCSDYYQR